MIAWIKSLFCNHKYKLAQTVQEMDYNYKGEKVTVGCYDVYICEKCLKRKKIRY